MTRFWFGTVFGMMAGITATFFTIPLHAALIGLAVAVLIWFGVELLTIFLP